MLNRLCPSHPQWARIQSHRPAWGLPWLPSTFPHGSANMSIDPKWLLLRGFLFPPKYSHNSFSKFPNYP